MPDSGFSPDAIEFFDELERNNTTAWWRQNRQRYDECVRSPFVRLLEELPVQPWRVYRPNRDTRFSADKQPYKTFIGAVAQEPGGTGHFVQLSARGLLVGNGYPMMARDQLARFREAVDREASGIAFGDAVASTTAAGHAVTGGRYEPVATAPRGYRRNHARIEWLRWKGVEIAERAGTPEWLFGFDTADEVERLLRIGSDVTDWLDRHVGPSELSPEEIWGR